MKKDDDLPPIKNHLLYAYRVWCKIWSFIIFGSGSLFLATALFPTMKLFIHPHDKFQKAARFVISRTLAWFCRVMHRMGAADFIYDDKSKYKNLSHCIVVANHPSLLDVVFLFAVIPNADCIVRAGLSKHVISGIIKLLYIVNSLDVETLMDDCVETLNKGNTLIIFPEGTRTPRHGQNEYKRGAARAALASGCPLIPVHIGGTSKYGLGKHDPFFSYNHTEKYTWEFTMLEPIDPKDYADMPVPIAARKMTEKLSEILR